MSSSPMKTFTKRRRLPLSSKSRLGEARVGDVERLEGVPDGGAFDLDLAGAPGQGRNWVGMRTLTLIGRLLETRGSGGRLG